MFRAFRVVLVMLAIAAAADFLLLPGLRFLPDPFFRRSWDDITNGIRQQNNLLFLSPRDYPYPRSPDGLVVGVFGGSVAKGFAREMEEVLPSVEAARILSDKLHKRVRVENFAISGSSQPSQFNLLHLLGDQIDVAVFLDGLNELYSDEATCNDLEEFWAQNHKPAREILRPVFDLGEGLRAQAAAWWWPLAAYSSVFRLALFRDAARLNDISGDFFRTLGVVPKPSPSTGPNVDRRVQRWAGCVDLAARYAAAHGLPSFFFLQPSQYVPGAKPLTDEERQCCIYRQDEIPEIWALYAALPAAYAKFEQHIAELRAAGVKVQSLARVFQSSTQTIYVDKCCHVNSLGNQIMAEAIFAAIAAD
jgi:hypothetical protein